MRAFVVLISIFLLTSAGAQAGCTQFAHVKSWAGSITVTYDRTARTPNYLEHSSGGSSTSVTYAPSIIAVIAFNGYDETWSGPRSGSGHVLDEQMNADGSPLSRPVRVEGGGSLLSDPPLGRFGPEQFWISSTKCTYGFYTSAAVNAMHSRDGAMVAGTDVHVEAIPLPASGKLSGTRQFHLPDATNYQGGDQFHFPCLMIDWCNRDAGPGSATVTWTFTPGAAANAPPATASRPKCPKADSRTNSPSDRARADFAAALALSGHAVPLGDIVATTSGGVTKITVRLDASGHILPSTQCIDEGVANGSVAPGSQSGAAKILLATVQQASAQTRVTSRIDDVGTGTIERTGLGDASGTSDGSIQAATVSSLQHLGPF
jgi:hypothetical protein